MNNNCINYGFLPKAKQLNSIVVVVYAVAVTIQIIHLVFAIELCFNFKCLCFFLSSFVFRKILNVINSFFTRDHSEEKKRICMCKKINSSVLIWEHTFYLVVDTFWFSFYLNCIRSLFA